MIHRESRRQFLKSTAVGLSASVLTPYIFTAHAADADLPRSKNDRPRFAAVGMRYQGSVIARKAALYGDIVAVCDVDTEILAKAREEFGAKTVGYDDHRKMLERNDIDALLIGTPDHWHTPMLIDACRAGKDVYCEKPLTLTVDEGKQIAKVVKETKRVVQVGSWQRSDSRFRLAVELARSGRLGKIQKLSVALNLNKTGGPFPITEPPKSLNWDRWLGPAPLVPYIAERTHNTFRWWYEYAGGQVTDWGAHHIDIAQWILGHENTSPVKIETKGEFAAASDRSFNVPKSYFLRYIYHDGTVIEVIEEGRAGIMIEGDRGRIFVNRGTVSGAPIEQLAKTPFPREQFKLYARDNLTRPERAGKLDAIINHMGNFYDCLQSRELPISDIHTQHRTATTCHLANISLRLGRTLQWDPQAEKFVDDAEADSMLSRTPRKGYEFSA